jgi:hypothetical protein
MNNIQQQLNDLCTGCECVLLILLVLFLVWYFCRSVKQGFVQFGGADKESEPTLESGEVDPTLESGEVDPTLESGEVDPTLEGGEEQEVIEVENNGLSDSQIRSELEATLKSFKKANLENRRKMADNFIQMIDLIKLCEKENKLNDDSCLSKPRLYYYNSQEPLKTELFNKFIELYDSNKLTIDNAVDAMLEITIKNNIT